MYQHTLSRSILLLVTSALVSFVVAAGGTAAAGAEPDDDAGAESAAPLVDVEKPLARVEERVTVLGDRESLATIPGSAHFLGHPELDRQQHSDIHRILRQVPGINIQEEEGYGLRPNIGLRGTGVERSQKITLMEDGVLIAPAPYTAPSAYYFPTAARMEAFEVRKGSSAVQQGPYTNGGAINLVSRSIPGTLGGQVSLSATRESLRGDAFVGESRQRLGWMVETYQLQGTSFKQLDGGREAEIELRDYLAKGRISSSADADLYQTLELKLGRTDHYGEETYLGLTREDFDRTPLRRYAASQEDWLDSSHDQLQLRYFAMPHSRLDVTSTVYRNRFDRNWYKLEKVRGQKTANVVESPELWATEIGILRGELDSDPEDLAVRNNRRRYVSEGWQTKVGLDLGAEGRHRVELGLRLHRDSEDRFQEVDSYRMAGGRMSLTRLGEPGSDSNRVSEAEAIALFAVDKVTLGRFTLSPGVRFESIRYSRRDFGQHDPERLGSALKERYSEVEELIPGVGLSYAASRQSTLFVGLHKGFAPPGPSSSDAVAEESLNLELGWRRSGRRVDSDVVGFVSDYDNLLGRDTTSGGGTGTGEQFNGGEVLIHGLEATLASDPGVALAGERLSLPLRLVYTYTASEFRSSFETSFSDWAPEVEVGDELPYLPVHQLHLSASLVGRKWSGHLDANYSSATRSRAGQGAIPDDELIDERLVLDLGGDYSVGKRLNVSCRVRNLLDETYVVARRPAGLRPGLPRTFQVGLQLTF